MPMKIYTYSEQCTQAGNICLSPENYTPESEDIVSHEGSREQLIIDAKDDIRVDHTAVTDYQIKTAKAILEYLGVLANEI